METKFKIGDRVRISKSSQWYTGTDGNPYCEGSIDEVGESHELSTFVNWDNGSSNTYRHSDLELVTENKSTTNNNIQMKYFKTKEILSRSITVCVAVDGSNVNTGYAVRRMDDEPNVELAKRISFGRANNPKTNLTKGMLITPQLTEKYILAAIANKVLADIENGTIVIKGIRG